MFGFPGAQILDITEQHAHEQQLEAAKAEVEAIFDAVRVGLVLIGPDGRYLRMNRRHAEALDVAHPNGHGGAAGGSLLAHQIGDPASHHAGQLVVIGDDNGSDSFYRHSAPQGQ